MLWVFCVLFKETKVVAESAKRRKQAVTSEKVRRSGERCGSGEERERRERRGEENGSREADRTSLYLVQTGETDRERERERDVRTQYKVQSTTQNGIGLAPLFFYFLFHLSVSTEHIAADEIGNKERTDQTRTERTWHGMGMGNKPASGPCGQEQDSGQAPPRSAKNAKNATQTKAHPCGDPGTRGAVVGRTKEAKENGLLSLGPTEQCRERA